MKIGIGGGRESKWKTNQVTEVKAVIRAILLGQCALPYIKEGDIRTKLELVGWKKEEDIKWNEQFPKANGWRSNAILVSGHCHRGGVDIWAEEIAKELGIEIELHPAPAKSWEDKRCPSEGSMREYPFAREYNSIPHIEGCMGGAGIVKGYRSRNIDMAKSCGVWFAIEVAASCKRCHGAGAIECSSTWGDGMEWIEKCNYCEGDGANGGATWTLKYARKLGKEVYKVIIK